ncbi:hypothetical protein [Neobacillus sp. CF12]|uniref:hypothetical protein n=1 Tax=Neobacillus sp. CF12 TaxID=3055864 RepID=UPI0025A1F284|nr:hypothetical protein [Neobacillus sp. CF12]MDM5331618.1 hypothetical protein [Neobacillus sp. CF12]
MKFASDIWANNPAKDIMSYFSSMGTTSTLDFKPEMSAPGGNIYSNVPGTEPKSIVILALDYAGNDLGLRGEIKAILNLVWPFKRLV